jgi:hypothetical protein
MNDNFDLKQYLSSNTLLKESQCEGCTRQRLDEKKKSKNILSPKKSKPKDDDEELDFNIEDDETGLEDIQATPQEQPAEEQPEMEDSQPISKEAGMSKEQTDIQKSLKMAYDSAMALGDEKLATQIGNSLTYFMKTHILNR